MKRALRFSMCHFALISLATAMLLPRELAAAQTSKETPYITTADAQLRKGPGANYGVVQNIPKETRISVVGKEGSWLKVQSKHGRASGYIEDRSARPIAVAVTKSASSTGAGAYITTGEVNLREGPGTKYKVIRKVPKDTKINVVRTDGSWLRVESKTGNPPGYIDKRFAKKLP
jgi:uncharacterized protein YgiM (DUF1202 family)